MIDKDQKRRLVCIQVCAFATYIIWIHVLIPGVIPVMMALESDSY